VQRWLKAGTTVVVNGSRLHVAEAVAAFPELEVVYVTAAPEICRERMATRGREASERISERLARGSDWQPPAGVPVIQLINESSPKVAAYALAQLLIKGFGTWTAELIDRTRPAQPARSVAPPREPLPHRARRTTSAGNSLATRR
jgi:ribose 1,5-bisphosphokinase PhnN